MYARLPLPPRWVALFALVGGLTAEQARRGARDEAHASVGAGARPSREFAGAPVAPVESAAARRAAAHRADVAAAPPGRDVHDVALDDEVTAEPFSEDGAPGSEPLAAIDGSDETAWVGAAGRSAWIFTVPFRRPVHVALLRALYGDAADRGVPSAYAWQYLAPAAGSCDAAQSWLPLPDGTFDDRHPNQFVHGSMHVHARRQALFADADACAVRLVVHASEGKVPPVVRSLRILEGAPSVARGARVDATPRTAALPGTRAENVLDGRYETAWAGAPGLDGWTLDVTLPTARVVDRVSLVVGLDAVTLPPRGGDARRRYGVSYAPLRYEVSTADADDAPLVHAPEGDPKLAAGEVVLARRRLVTLAAPRKVKRLRVRIFDATDGLGGTERALAAPVVRDLALYDAGDPRPVVTAPTFLSVSANPAALAKRGRWGQVATEGQFARDLDHRLRRALVGFDADTGWTADVSRRRDLGAGRFLEVIEGDDPTLDRPLVEALSPPPVLVLSGSLDWEFDERTAPPLAKGLAWKWAPLAPADSVDAGIGQLAELVRARAAPMVGFCGGAHLLALLEARGALPAGAPSRDVIDAVMARNVNRPVRPMRVQRNLYEWTWWTDGQTLDAKRPAITFDPRDPLFAFAAADPQRAVSRELPVSHVDMLRASAFDPGGPLERLAPVAWSEFCRPFVDPSGPEPTTTTPDGRRCVRVPHAFRSRDDERFPIVGFQFHPEQRDLTRLAPGDPADARGDAMNIIANTVDLILESYRRVYWPRG